MIDWLKRLLEALFLWATGSVKRPEDLPESVPANGEPKWLVLARKDLGIREIAGPASNPEIMRSWDHVDYQPPNGDETAWCSAKACEWVEDAGLPSTRAPNARSWLKWGHAIDKPRLGCLVVFWRGSPDSWQGHVALYLGPGDKPGTIKVLGGNQSNSVSIADYSLAQLLGYRWPTTGGNSRTLRAQTAGTFGDVLTIAVLSQKGILEALPDMLAFSEGVKSLAVFWPWFAVVGICISLAARAVTVWARVTDWKEKGV